MVAASTLLLASASLAELPLDVTEVFTPGAAGYFGFRIPSLLVTQHGTVLAFAEGRPKSAADVGGNDLVLRRSTDGGRTWSEVMVIAEDGPRSLNTPCSVQDRQSGRIILFYHKYPEGTHEHRLAAGTTGEKSLRAMMLTSDDDGRTWSKEIDITDQVKRPNVTFFSTGPGIGIQLRRGPHAGRIIMPTNRREEGKKKGDLFAIFSDDGGKTWTSGQTASNPTEKGYGNEVQAVELADGRLMLNARNVNGDKIRKVTTSADAGQTWQPIRDEPALVEPVCQGSIFRYSDPLDGQPSRILFSNPASDKARRNGTVRLSYDEGNTWPVIRVIEPRQFGYSCLGRLPDGTVLCLFECDGYKTIRLVRFTLEWLTQGVDRG
jgi:sialidase-1